MEGLQDIERWRWHGWIVCRGVWLSNMTWRLRCWGSAWLVSSSSRICHFSRSIWQVWIQCSCCVCCTWTATMTGTWLRNRIVHQIYEQRKNFKQHFLRHSTSVISQSLVSSQFFFWFVILEKSDFGFRSSLEANEEAWTSALICLHLRPWDITPVAVQV